MARVKVRKEIEIERNPIEKFLMSVRDLIKDNRKVVVTSLVGVLVLVLVVIGSLVFVESESAKELVEFEKIMDEYNSGSGAASVDKTEASLKKMIDTTCFGYAHDMSHYVLGNIYYTQKKYDEAQKYLELFSSKTSSPMFAAIALQKAALAAEEAGNLKKALEFYAGLEENYDDSVVADQFYYNAARVHGKLGDRFSAKKYYDRVVSLYPHSPFSERAKKQLLLIGLIK